MKTIKKTSAVVVCAVLILSFLSGCSLLEEMPDISDYIPSVDQLLGRVDVSVTQQERPEKVDNDMLQVEGDIAGDMAEIQEEVEDKTPSPAGSFIENFSSYAANKGWTDTLLKRADVADIEGEEVLCICKDNGEWMLHVLSAKDNIPSLFCSVSLKDYACYLVNAGDKETLLTYYQRVAIQSDGQNLSSYGYTLFRFDANKQVVNIDKKSIQYNSDTTKDPTEISRFFDAFQAYVPKFQVLGDPYAVTGKYWIEQGQTDYGTAPAETANENATAEGKAGYVSVSKEDSWLNLRVGPGTKYDRVLLNPNDPDSFVRQAKGAPVTVLETVNTGDADNPVWVKIKIRYADRELVGYSTKSYITVYGE